MRCSGATRGHLMAVGKTAPDPAGTVPREQRAEPACACVARVVFATRQRAVAPRRSPRRATLRLPPLRERAGVRVGNLATATTCSAVPAACISRTVVDDRGAVTALSLVCRVAFSIRRVLRRHEMWAFYSKRTFPLLRYQGVLDPVRLSRTHPELHHVLWYWREQSGSVDFESICHKL